jgi:hypothetical protein
MRISLITGLLTDNTWQQYTHKQNKCHRREYLQVNFKHDTELYLAS